MNKPFTNRILQLLAVCTIFLFSCTEDDGGVDFGSGDQGYYIVNEGAFGNGNTSISFYDKSTGQVTNNVFYTTNGIPLGDQAQSMTIHNDYAYIAVQNSSKIEVVDLDDFSSIVTVNSGIESPRYFVGLDEDKGYVSDWGSDGVSGTVKVLDLNDFTVTKTIEAGSGTDQMLIVGSNLYVVNAGGWGSDNTLVIIDTETDEVTQTIELADNPNSLQVDSDGNIWVAASGYTAYDWDTYEIIEEESTSGALIKLDGNGTVLTTLSFDVIGSSPSNLSINGTGDMLYYTFAGAVYEMSIAAESLPAEVFISESYYGLAVDPVDGSIIGCEAPDFSSAGNVDIYSSIGELIETHVVGIGPNSCTFK